MGAGSCPCKEDKPRQKELTSVVCVRSCEAVSSMKTIPGERYAPRMRRRLFARGFQSLFNLARDLRCFRQLKRQGSIP